MAVIQLMIWVQTLVYASVPIVDALARQMATRSHCMLCMCHSCQNMQDSSVLLTQHSDEASALLFVTSWSYRKTFNQKLKGGC